MTEEPFDFESIVAGIDLELLTGAHRRRASMHVQGEDKGVRVPWSLVEKFHDLYDTAHFDARGLSSVGDEWDNRRKTERA